MWAVEEPEEKVLRNPSTLNEFRNRLKNSFGLAVDGSEGAKVSRTKKFVVSLSLSFSVFSRVVLCVVCFASI